MRSVLDSIRRIVRVLRVSSRAAEKRVGLSGAQLFVLQKLADGPALSLNELAGRTRTHQSSVSVVVQRLVDRGMVTRTRSGADGRRIEMSLTAKARALLRKAPGAAQEQLIGAVERLPREGQRQLARLLEQVVRDTGIAGEAVEMFFEDGAVPQGPPAVTPARSPTTDVVGIPCGNAHRRPPAPHHRPPQGGLKSNGRT